MNFYMNHRHEIIKNHLKLGFLCIYLVENVEYLVVFVCLCFIISRLSYALVYNNNSKNRTKINAVEFYQHKSEAFDLFYKFPLDSP